MPFYLVTGAARGLGFEFIRQLSADPENVVFGIVRDREATTKKVAAEIQRANIHIVQADMTNDGALKEASEFVSTITGGCLAYIVSNAGIGRKWSMIDGTADLANEPERLETELMDHYRPLILKGNAKKIIAISSCMGDIDFVREIDLYESGPYGLRKTALNMVVARYSAQFRKQGVLFMSLCPGMVATDVVQIDEDMRKFNIIAEKFKKYAPHWAGASKPEAAVAAVVSVLHKSSLENGDAGGLFSYTGTKRFL